MVSYLIVCDGGPNDEKVYQVKKTLDQAIGTLKFMMKSLGATLGWIEKMEETINDKTNNK